MMHKAFDSMSDKLNCSYCGRADFPVGEKPLKRWSKQHGLTLNTPICGRCFLSIKNKNLPATITLPEYKLVEKVHLLKSTAHGLSKKTPLDRIQKMFDEMDDITSAYSCSIVDFGRKAKEAQHAARKVEWLRKVISDAKFVIAGKMQTSYECCRRVANKCCSDIEIRNAVFARDNFVCVYCGKDENLSVDHIKSVKIGGSNEMENLQTLCLPCNVKKGWKFKDNKIKQKSKRELLRQDSSPIEA